MNTKKYVYSFISFILVAILLFLLAIYSYDPLQVFHKHWNKKDTFSGNMRQQALGIVKNYQFDSIILGSSQLENTSSKEASKKLGGQFINISISGSDYYERELILNYLLKRKNIKTVIYSLDNLGKTRKGHEKYPLSSFDYLYDTNPLNDFKVYMNHKYIKCLISFSEETRCIGHKLDLDRPKAWYKKKHHQERFGGLENWFKGNNSKKALEQYINISGISKKVSQHKIRRDKDVDRKIIASKEYINTNILSLISKYPKVKFILVLPPYPRLKFAIEAQYNVDIFKIYNETIKYIVKENHKYPNLEVYGWGDKSFLDDIKIYKDTVHYNHEINSWMLDEISNKKGLLTESNINVYLEEITKRALNFDLISFGKSVDELLKKYYNEPHKSNH